MTENEKQALRNSMAGKKVSEMTAQERKLFDQEFQYGFAQKPQREDATIKPAQLSTPKDLTNGYRGRINLIIRR